MAQRTWSIYGSIFLYLYMGFVCQNVIMQEVKRPWYETQPHVSMDFKVHIDAGKEECFYQYVQEGAAFFVSYDVIHGGDGMIGFAVQHPNNTMVHPYAVKESSTYADDKSTGGFYSFCMDNQQSKFIGRLVDLYITTAEIDGWQKYEKEIQDLHLNIQNFTAIINQVESNMHVMNHFQSHQRNLESKDIALLTDNNSYVQYWSLAEIAAVIITCTCQVYFVRKLFDTKR